jgi:hypothetical protein
VGDARDRPVAVKPHADGRWLAHDDARRFHRNQRPAHGWQDGHIDVADDDGGVHGLNRLSAIVTTVGSATGGATKRRDE